LSHENPCDDKRCEWQWVHMLRAAEEYVDLHGSEYVPESIQRSLI